MPGLVLEREGRVLAVEKMIVGLVDMQMVFIQVGAEW